MNVRKDAGVRAIEDYIHEPTIVMLGVAPWPPRFREGEPCPVCNGGIKHGDNNMYCACCDSASPAVESKIRAARIGLKCKSGVELAEKKAREALAKAHPVLTESQRRRIWHGSKTEFDTKIEVANRAAVGRAWLAEHGWEPNWSIVLKKRSRGSG